MELYIGSPGTGILLTNPSLQEEIEAMNKYFSTHPAQDIPIGVGVPVSKPIPLSQEAMNKYFSTHPAQDIPIGVGVPVSKPINNLTYTVLPQSQNIESQNQTGLDSMLNPFSNFNYKPPADISQYAVEPYNSEAQLNTMRNPAAFFNMPAQQASTAINTTANTNVVKNSNVPSNLPANNSIPQTSAQNPNPIESVITDIQTVLDNLFKSIFGK